MNTTRTVLFLAAVALLTILGGCGSSGNVSPVAGETAKATVVLSASFPGSDGAVKSLIPTDTDNIRVYAIPLPNNTYPPQPTAVLTRAQPTQTIQLPAGLYRFEAQALDASGNLIADTATAGELVVGVTNTVELTFLKGQWTLVDANDNPSPLVLSNGKTLHDFLIGGMYYPQPAKSAFDPAKPFDFMDKPVRFRFEGFTSARTVGGFATQFVGSTKTNLFETEAYNLTKKCGFYNYYGMPCEVSAGDQVVMIMSNADVYGESSYVSSMLYADPYSLLPNKGSTKIVQNGTVLDFGTMLKETTVTGGNLITGSLVEWLPSTDRTWNLGTPAAAAKAARSAKVVKAQSANTPYTGLTITDYEPLVCSGTNPQDRGTWSFANNTSAGKIVIGSRVCYRDGWLNSQWDPNTMTSVTNAGDYSWGFTPADTNNLGDYCHVWDWNTNTCGQQLPGTGEVYNPWNFRAMKSPSKTTIDYGSFRFQWWGERVQQGSAYVYDFRAKGGSSITPFVSPSP